MRHKYEEGRAWFEYCPKCWEIILEVHIGGTRTNVSRFSVSTSDANVLRKFVVVYGIWHGWTQLSACAMDFAGRPVRGRWYVEHQCGFRK